MDCGEFYTVAATVDSELIFWGTRFKSPPGTPLEDSWSGVQESTGESLGNSGYLPHKAAEPMQEGESSPSKEHSSQDKPDVHCEDRMFILFNFLLRHGL